MPGCTITQPTPGKFVVKHKLKSDSTKADWNWEPASAWNHAQNELLRQIKREISDWMLPGSRRKAAAGILQEVFPASELAVAVNRMAEAVLKESVSRLDPPAPPDGNDREKARRKIHRQLQNLYDPELLAALRKLLATSFPARQPYPTPEQYNCARRSREALRQVVQDNPALAASPCTLSCP